MIDDIKPLNLSSENSAKPEMGGSTTNPAAATRQTGRINDKKAKKKMISWIAILVILGAVSGLGLAKRNQPTAPKKMASAPEGEAVAGETYGVMDESAFSDTAEGTIAMGGIDGEGSHHLIREGGESQFVYLTSSTIDLDQFVDKNVKVWGQTFEAQKAGWLMDVGRLQILK